MVKYFLLHNVLNIKLYKNIEKKYIIKKTTKIKLFKLNLFYKNNI